MTRIADGIDRGDSAAKEMAACLELLIRWYGQRSGDDDALIDRDDQPDEIVRAMNALDDWRKASRGQEKL